MTDLEYLQEQRTLARQAFTGALRHSTAWVRNGTMVRQVARRFPIPLAAAAAVAGCVVGIHLIALMRDTQPPPKRPALNNAAHHASVLSKMVKVARLVGVLS